LGTATAALLARQQEYRAAVVALVEVRVALKLIDLRSSDEVHSVQRAAEDAGKAVGKAVAAAVFLGGITPIVKPMGSSEVTALRLLEGRIAAARDWTGREAQGARVTTVRTAYQDALRRRAEGMATAASKRALRNAAKEDFLDAFASVAASIQKLFLRDRARQNVFFDVLRHAGRVVDELEGTDDDADEPDEP
jgi:hypothetical protein